MSNVDKQIETIQAGVVIALQEIELAMLNKQNDIAFNMVVQLKKDMQNDLINKKRVSTDDNPKLTLQKT